MTGFRISITQANVARKKEIESKVLATLYEGTLDRIAAVLDEGENRTQFIRDAIEAELRRRERAKRREGQQS